MISKKFQIMLVFSLILLVMPLVSAVETSIGVETLPGHHVTLNILNAKTDDLYKSLEGNASTSGIASFTYTSSSTRDINIYTIIRNENGKIVLTKKFTGMTTGNAITLKVIDETNKLAASSPPAPNLTVNNSPQNNTPVNLSVNITAKNDTNVTSNVTSNATSFNFESAASGLWNNILGYSYIILIVVIVLALAFLIYWFWPTISSKLKSIKPTQFAKTGNNFDTGESKELIHAERKLKQLEEEIYKIKNRGKRIAEAERKFEEAKRELERVKKE
ncbi:ATP synthase F0 subunit B [Candidatus Pacearchaeota archaeon]|nr:ATP synthase F0 subunit B [Candidatus Pacearchaeota archaeon]